MYVDLVNHINGAKLRTKYFQNSNLGTLPHHGEIINIQGSPSQSMHNLHENRLLREMERIKPIH
jgi:hypothetical protein